MPSFDFHSFIASQVTPFYFYDAEIIAARCADLAAFDVIRYAQKACSNTAILRLVQRCGAVVDAVSANEIRRALHAGFSAQKNSRGTHEIVYTADIFDADAFELVVKEKIHVNCGSLDMIAQYGEKLHATENCESKNETGEITLRINPGFGHGHSRKTNTGGDTSKHGIWHEQYVDAQKLAAKYNLRVTGLHVHIGSGTDLSHLAQVASFVENFAAHSATHFSQTLTTISAGGGISVPYRPHDERIDLEKYYAIWDGAKTRLENQIGRKLILEVEPGRYLVAESGVLVTTICAVKKQGENTFYLVDAGFNDLARAAMYGAYHPMKIIHRNCSNENQSREKIEVIIGGPLCESGDIFTQEEGGIVVKRLLPRAEVGDFLIIENAGAYGAAMSSNYNSRALAAEFLLENNVPRIIRRRQTFAEIISCEE